MNFKKHLIENQVYYKIVVLIIWAVVAMLIGMQIGKDRAENENRNAIEFWGSIERICELNNAVSEFHKTLLPNGNMGFYITCKAKQVL
jgi:hypothetical protein